MTDVRAAGRGCVGGHVSLRVVRAGRGVIGFRGGPDLIDRRRCVFVHHDSEKRMRVARDLEGAKSGDSGGSGCVISCSTASVEAAFLCSRAMETKGVDCTRAKTSGWRLVEGSGAADKKGKLERADEQTREGALCE